MISRLLPVRSSIGEQLAISVGLFAYQTYLVRALDPFNFGVFAFWLAVAYFVAGLHSAMVSVPLATYLNSTTWTSVLNPLPVFNAVGLAVLVGVSFLSFVASVSGHVAADLSWLDVAAPVALLASWVLREHVRGVAFALADASLLPVCGMCFAFLLIAFPVTAELTSVDIDATSSLLWLSVASVLSVCPYGLRRLKALRPQLRPEAIRAFWSHRASVSWSTMGVLLSELQSRAFVYVVPLHFGPEALAQLVAPRIVLNPFQVVLGALVRPLRPLIAAETTTYGLPRTLLRTRRYVLWSLGAYLLFAVAVWTAYPFLEQVLFRAYPDTAASSLLLWTAITLVMIPRTWVTVALHASSYFKGPTVSTAYGALVGLPLLFLFLQYSLNPLMLLLAVLVSEAVASGACVGILNRRSRLATRRSDVDGRRWIERDE